ncbi:MAG TPA: DinB family protein, partial [Ktedonobacterales bacterium]|nr:DinB family protein [Ktedonobacterales bacterium]
MTASNLSSQQVAALTAFDAARDAFLAAFADVPDAALAYVPAGDEYAVGTLLPHLCDPINRYLDVLGLARNAGFGLVDLAADPMRAEREAQRHAQLAATRPTGADRARLLADLAFAHEQAHGAVAALD